MRSDKEKLASTELQVSELSLQIQKLTGKTLELEAILLEKEAEIETVKNSHIFEQEKVIELEKQLRLAKSVGWSALVFVDISHLNNFLRRRKVPTPLDT